MTSGDEMKKNVVLTTRTTTAEAAATTTTTLVATGDLFPDPKILKYGPGVKR